MASYCLRCTSRHLYLGDHAIRPPYIDGAVSIVFPESFLQLVIAKELVVVWSRRSIDLTIARRVVVELLERDQSFSDFFRSFAMLALIHW